MKRNLLGLMIIIALSGCGGSSGGTENEVTSSATIESLANSEEENIIAKEIYADCIGCHGEYAERNALQKSDIIADWTSAEIEEALLGYKYYDRNIYGMGDLMKGQVSMYSDYEISILSNYIANL